MIPQVKSGGGAYAALHRIKYGKEDTIVKLNVYH